MKDKQYRGEIHCGQWVRLNGTNARAEVLEAPDKRGRVRVAIGSMTLVVSLSEITVLEQKKKRSQAKPKLRQDSSLTLRIDLHGNTREQALERLETLLDRALYEGAARLEIIHGHGTGIVRKAVHDYLTASRHVQSFHLDVANSGTTWAIL